MMCLLAVHCVMPLCHCATVLCHCVVPLCHCAPCRRMIAITMATSGLTWAAPCWPGSSASCSGAAPAGGGLVWSSPIPQPCASPGERVALARSRGRRPAERRAPPTLACTQPALPHPAPCCPLARAPFLVPPSSSPAALRKLSKDVRGYVQKCVDKGKEVNLTSAINKDTITRGLRCAEALLCLHWLFACWTSLLRGTSTRSLRCATGLCCARLGFHRFAWACSCSR